MKKHNKKLKGLVFSLGLAAMMLTANNLNAQNGGGLFGRGATFYDYAAISSEEGLMQRSGAGDATITGSGIQNGNFEVVTPLGGGIAILLVAGLGYVALKKKEDEQ